MYYLRLIVNGISILILWRFRKLAEIEEENGKLSRRFDELQEAFAVTKADAKLLSETVSKLETEKAETTAKLICVQSENDRMKQELIQLKVVFEIANLKSIICNGYHYVYSTIDSIIAFIFRQKQMKVINNNVINCKTWKNN